MEKQNIDPLNYLLIVAFGMSSWIGVNSIWVELPMFVKTLPEKWALPSYFAIIIQMGNFATIFFIVYNLRTIKLNNPDTTLKSECATINNEDLLSPQNRKYFSYQSRENIAVYALLALQSASIFVTIFTWNLTSVVGGQVRSTYLFVLLLLISVTNCSSHVVFLPYLSHFPSPSYVTAYYVGVGLGGFAASALSLIQGWARDLNSPPSECHHPPGRPYTAPTDLYPSGIVTPSIFNDSTSTVTTIGTPNFSVAIFFAIVWIITIVSSSSFLTLNLPKVIMRRRKRRITADFDDKLICRPHGPEDVGALPLKDRPKDETGETTSLPQTPQPIANTSKTEMAYNGIGAVITMLCLLAWTNSLSNGINPSIQSFATLPFGPRTFHLAISLSSLANPCTSFLAFFYPLKRLPYLATLTIMATLMSAYIFAMALMSPRPPLVGTTAGSSLNVCLWIGVNALFSYNKACLASLFHAKGRRWLLWCGAVTQFGSAVGAFAAFLMINVFSLFKSGRSCS